MTSCKRAVHLVILGVFILFTGCSTDFAAKELRLRSNMKGAVPVEEVVQPGTLIP